MQTRQIRQDLNLGEDMDEAPSAVPRFSKRTRGLDPGEELQAEAERQLQEEHEAQMRCVRNDPLSPLSIYFSLLQLCWKSLSLSVFVCVAPRFSLLPFCLQILCSKHGTEVSSWSLRLI
jgi:hypothetical protein